MYHHSAEKLEFEIRQAVPTVEAVHFDDPTPFEFIVTVVLPTMDWGARARILEVVDDIARQYVREVTIVGRVIDAEAASELSLA